MKKAFVIGILFIVCAVNVCSQTSNDSNKVQAPRKTKDYCPHRINVYASSGYTNPMYFGMNSAFIHNNYSLSSALEISYGYFFTPQWGLSLGIAMSRFTTKGTLNFSGVIPNYEDPNFSSDGSRSYDLYYSGNNLVEKQTIWGVEVPLQAHFEHKLSNNHGIYASLGAKGYFPVIAAQSSFPADDGKLIIKGYEEFTNTWYDDVRPYFGQRDARTTPSKVKMRYSVDVIAEFGGVMRIANNCDFYLGAYGSYGFLDILPKEKTDFITNEVMDPLTVNSLLGSHILSDYNTYVTDNNKDWKKVSETWNRWQVGLKIGFHIKPCANLSKSKDRPIKEVQREFYEKVPKAIKEGNGNSASSSGGGTTTVVILHDTVQPVYIYNITPTNYLDDPTLTQEDKENITALANILSNGKILFDLDQDKPKISNHDFILETVKVLKKDPNLGLIIEGYTCDLGGETHNRDLATRRANAVRQLFVDNGVSPKQIRVSAFIFSDPESKLNIPTDDRQEHRSVIFRIIKNK